jgi:hypothetical protein
LRHHLKRLRVAQHLVLTAAVSALAATGLTILTVKPALAEYQIQEATIDKGEIQAQYRGASHWGVPKAADQGDDAGGDQEEAPLRQSNELEGQYSVTDWWMLSSTLGVDQPDGEDLNVSSVEFETQFQFLKRHGDGIALSVQGGYEKAINHGDDQNADEIGFGPIVELAKGPLLLTLNPLFTDQVGDNRQTSGLGFDYGWRAEYDFVPHWGVGVEMFGQIEDLTNAGSFNSQEHSIGPTLFYNFGDNDDDAAGDDDNNKGNETPRTQFSLNVGIQFGLTDATSDGALKFQGELDF